RHRRPDHLPQARQGSEGRLTRAPPPAGSTNCHERRRAVCQVVAQGLPGSSAASASELPIPGMALALRHLVELVLQRYSWAGTLVAVVLGAYLSARIVNTLAASAIAPKPSLLQQSVGASPQAAPVAPRVELDANRLAKTFDLPVPKPAGEAGPAEVPTAKVWNAIPVRSSLRGILAGTAPANPPRYSPCQPTNSGSNETLAYAT